jgi:hypothetical protein
MSYSHLSAEERLKVYKLRAKSELSLRQLELVEIITGKTSKSKLKLKADKTSGIIQKQLYPSVSPSHSTREI